jgi:hypothetical protein
MFCVVLISFGLHHNSSFESVSRTIYLQVYVRIYDFILLMAIDLFSNCFIETQISVQTVSIEFISLVNPVVILLFKL